MPFNTDQIQPSGGLNKDIDLSLVPNGDYLDALNVQHITENGNTSYAIFNTLGNKFRFEIPQPTLQLKKYLIRIYTDGTTARQITFYKTDGSVWFTVNYTDNAVFATAFTNFQTAFNAAIAAAVPVQTGNAVNLNPYAEVELTTGGIPYDFTIQSTGVNEVEVIVKQEAIASSLLGKPNVIGSYDLLGDLFIWSTPSNSLPTELSVTITGATNPASPNPIEITTSGNHNLTTGDEVLISGVLGQTAANGTWIVTVTGLNTFTLFNSIGVGAYTGGGTITINTNSIGEIGVATYDENTDVFTYTRLIRSKEFNFRTQKQVDTYCEANFYQRSIYWTDDYNSPRVFYYKADYIVDGAIEIVNSANSYAYGTINDETKLTLTNQIAYLVFDQQIQSGGAIKSGNWRYAIRLLTANNDATNWSDLSNPINASIASTTGSASAMSGDNADVTTPKINQFTVFLSKVGLFKYVQLAAVNYVGGVASGFIVDKFEIVGDQLTIQHTGNETDVVNLDVATLNAFNYQIKTAKNITAIDNRLILSNLTTSASLDFTQWVGTWTHSLYKKSIDAVRYSNNGTLRVAEYSDPENVYNNVGYMLYETYRFYAKFLLKDGTITNSFWIDDIKFDTNTYARRNNTLNNYSLTDSAGDTVYVPYVEFETIDLEYLIDGVKARDLIEFIYIERLECVPEVLFSGVGVLAYEYTVLPGLMSIQPVVLPPTPPSPDGFACQYSPNSTDQYIGEFIANDAEGTFGIYPDGGIGGFANSARRNFVSFYAPDILYGKTSASFVNGDKIVNFDQPTIGYNTAIQIGNDHYQSNYYELTGYNQTVNEQEVDVDFVTTLGFGQNTTIGSKIYTKLLYRGAPSNNDNWSYITTPIIRTTSNIVHTNANNDYATYNMVYYRPKANKYGDIEDGRTIPTGAYYQIVLGSPSVLPIGSGIEVFGGDVFTQKTYVKNRFASQSSSFGVTDLGWQQGFTFYSQNRVNVQMSRRYDSPSLAWIYPNTSLSNWLDDTANIAGPYYNDGYTINNGISSNVAFDVNLPTASDLPTQIRWSELKPQNSITDNFRNFLPLNFKDLPLTFGEITHHANYNGELFTWQPRMVQRQYFNTRGTMNVNDTVNTEVLIGDGSVMSRDGQMISSIGTYHKWSVIKGRSAQGNDTFYWINTELKKAMRLGFDGTISVSDIQGMQSWFANNLTWVRDKDYPASGQGICGVWDDRYISAIWTIRGVRVFAEYDATQTYSIGDVVSFTPTVFSTFERTGELYVSIVNSNTGNTPPDFGSPSNFWVLIPHTGSVEVAGQIYNGVDYYNEYTIEYNEQKNKFTSFYTFKPKIYLKWTDTFLTPSPAVETNDLYEHRLGERCKWYDSQEEDGYIELIYNKGINVAKQYLALWSYSEIVPKRIDYYTKKEETFIVDTEFENNNDYYAGPIKNDILTSSNGTISDEDTTRLIGPYLRIKITFEKLVYQKLVDTILKFFSQHRVPNK